MTRTYNATTRRVATDTHCANNHPWTSETTRIRKDGKRVCKVCARQSNQRYMQRVETEGPMSVRNGAKTHCPQQHPYELFGRDRSDGARYCTICHRRNRIRAKYGLTGEEWDALVLKQEGRCAICLAEHGDLHVDHDHSDGRVRGLLCTQCNNGLGRFEDDTVRLRAAAMYIIQSLSPLERACVFPDTLPNGGEPHDYGYRVCACGRYSQESQGLCVCGRSNT